MKKWIFVFFILFSASLSAQETVDSISILKEQLNKDKNVQKIKEKDKEIANLKKQITALTARIEQMKKDSTQAVEDRQVAIEQVRNQFRQDSLEMAQKISAAEALEAFKGPWLAQLAKSVDTDWLNKTFQEIDPSQMEYVYSQYEAYSSADPKVAEARDKMKPLMEAFTVYKQGKQAVESPFDASVVNPLIKQVSDLRDTTTHLGRKAELDTLFEQLNYYSVAVEQFQNVIKAVDAIVSKQKPEDTDATMVELMKEDIQKAIDTLESSEESITTINSIPWLKLQYAEYHKTLMANIFAKNPIRDMIMDLKY